MDGTVTGKWFETVTVSGTAQGLLGWGDENLLCNAYASHGATHVFSGLVA